MFNHAQAYLHITAAEAHTLMGDFQRAFAVDAGSDFWVGAARIPLLMDSGKGIEGKLEFDPAIFQFILYRRALFFDAVTGEPLMASFDTNPAIGKGLRAHFEPLTEHHFHLDRSADSLKDDGPGKQRMEMVGSRRYMRTSQSVTAPSRGCP